MTIEERLAKLESLVANMQLAKDVVFSESVRKQMLQDAIQAGVLDTTLTGINQTSSTVVNAFPTTVTVNHAKQYTHRLRVLIDGNPYYIGLY